MASTDSSVSVAGERTSAKARHILIVEDDDVLLRGMRDLLELEGYRVSSGIDGLDGLRVLSKAADLPDLIISDIRMPNMDGYEFLSAVRAKPELLAIPFIFLTAKGQKEDIRYGRLRGVDDYITKPFDFRDLLVSVKSALLRHEELAAWQELRMEALKQRILTVLHHEFRTPLSYIVAYSDLLSTQPTFQKQEELQQYIRGIQEGSDRLSNLIESFLILAELESGYGIKIYERRQSLVEDLRGVVEEAAKSLEKRINDRKVAIDIAVAEGLPPIIGDRVYLLSAVRHLLDNGIKFSPRDANARVKVAMREDQGQIIYEVCDQGEGIPESELDLLFDTFYQINREKNEQQGAGAGLAIVRHVAALHGGSVEVDSKEGEGSCFRLHLPSVKLLNRP